MALKGSDIAKPVMINYKSKMLQGLGLCRDSSHVPQVIAAFLLIYRQYGLAILRFLHTVN